METRLVQINFTCDESLNPSPEIAEHGAGTVVAVRAEIRTAGWHVADSKTGDDAFMVRVQVCEAAYQLLKLNPEAFASSVFGPEFESKHGISQLVIKAMN